MTFGDFQGGELWVATGEEQGVDDKSQVHWRRDKNGIRRPWILVDTREKPYDLDPKIEHATQPWKGERWCLSFYISRGVEHIDEKDRGNLKKLGFPCQYSTAARTFGVNVISHDLLHNREPLREREGHDNIAKRTPQLSHFSDSVKCNPPASERQDGLTTCSEEEERVRECHRSPDPSHRGRPHESRSESPEGDMGGREAEEEGLSPPHKLEEKGPGRTEGDLQRDRGPRHGVSGRQALEQVGESKADIGDFNVGRAGQRVIGPAVGLQRLVRGVSAMRKLWNSTHDQMQSSDSRRILRMSALSSVPNHSSSELQWSSDRKSSEGVDCKEEAKYNVNLTKEEMNELLLRRKGKGDGKKETKIEAPVEVKK